MKKLSYVVATMLLSGMVSNASAIDIVGGDIPPLDNCGSHPFGLLDAFDATDWSPSIWGLNNVSKTAYKWEPWIAGIRVGSNGNIAIRFILSEANVYFFNKSTQFDNTNTRIPFSLEGDVIDHHQSLGEINKNDFKIVEENLSEDHAQLKEDVAGYDEKHALGIIIMRPDKLKANKVYQVILKPDSINGEAGAVHMNWQVTVNYKWMTAMARNYSSPCDFLDYIVDFKDNPSDESVLITENFGTKIPDEALEPWYYYAASNNSPSNKVPFLIGNDHNPAVCWNDYRPKADDPEVVADAKASGSKNPDGYRGSNYHGVDGQYVERIGTDYCILDDKGTNLWALSVGSTYHYIQTNNNNAGGSTKAKGNNPNNRPIAEQEVINPGSPRNNGLADISVKMTIAKSSGSSREHSIEQDPKDKFMIYPEIYNAGGRAENIVLEVYQSKKDEKDFTFKSSRLITTIKINRFNSGAKVRYPIELRAPEDGGDYYHYLRAVLSGDKNPDNNHSHENEKPTYAKLTVEEPELDVDLKVDSFQIQGGITALEEGESYGFVASLTNIGNDEPENYINTSFQITGPGTNNQWITVGEEGTKAENLFSGAIHEESVDDLKAPFGEGNYTARACVDSQKVEVETDESNNCTEVDFYVYASSQPTPTITIIHPAEGDNYRTDEPLHIEWETTNIAKYSNLRFYYSLDGGKTWNEADNNVVNDKSKNIDFCALPTKDSDNSLLMIESLDYPGVYGVSGRFTIDRASGCEEW